MFTGQKLSEESVVCTKCRRPLRASASCKRRYGPKCWGRVRPAVAALQASNSAPAHRAAALLIAGRMAPVAGHGGLVWRVPSLTGPATYLVHPEIDNCKAGLYTKLCYHKVAVRILVEV